MDVKLDNCRFCGSDDLDVNTFTNTGTETKDVLVYCKNCKSVADALTWNKHPFQDALRAEIEALKAQLAQYEEGQSMDTAPRDGTFILIKDIAGGYHIYQWNEWSNNSWWSFDKQYDLQRDGASRWFPLPGGAK